MNAGGHDLDRILEGLWQCLSHDKRPLGLLLGAGCPVSIRVSCGDDTARPLIPDIAGLTDAISKSLEGSDIKDQYETLLEGLTADLNREPNVEEILSRLRKLATVVGSETVRGLDHPAIDKLERAVTDAINRLVAQSLPPQETPYDDVVVWVGATTRSSPVRVFTTNYDLLLETAFEKNNTPYFDGFVGAREPFLDIEAIELDDLPSRWARLWKLHGSTNWTLLPSGRVVRREPHDNEERRLIHPSHLKYEESRRMPYLVMLDQLREFLKAPSATLVALGYSFGDDHINELLDHELRSNPSATVFGLQFNNLQDYPSACSLAASQPGLTLIAADGGVRAGTKAKWQPGPNSDTCKLGDFVEFGKKLRKLVRRPMPGSDTDEVSNGASEHTDAS